MKKITLLLLLFGISWQMSAQCIRTTEFGNITSNNSGLPQTITTCAYSTVEYSTIAGLLVGSDYIFTAKTGGTAGAGTDIYITLTDVSNNVILDGMSPLTVTGITEATVRLHYSEDAACAGVASCRNGQVQYLASCPQPTNLTVSNITTVSANLSWTPQGAATTWDLEWGAAGFVQGSGTAVNGLTSSTYSLSGLTNSSNYQFYVRSYCSVTDQSFWTGPFSFATSCLPVNNFSQNFDGVTTPNLPVCWGKIISNGASTFATVGTSTTNSSAPNGVNLYNSDSPSTSNIILVSPTLSNLSAGTHRIRFTGRNSTATQDIEIGTLSDPSDASTFTVLQTVDLSTTFSDYVVSFATYSGSNAYIGFRRLSTSTYTNVYLDNIYWEAIPAVAPSCTTNFVATPNATCGNFATLLTWDASANTDGYKLTVGTTSGGSNILNNSNIGNVTTYSINGNINTTYYYTVVPYNSAGDAVGCTENSFITVATGCYCTSVPTSNDGAGVSNVQVGTTDFVSGDITYVDHTATPVNLAQGINSNVQITFATGYTYDANIWIDFNNNYTFESTELVTSVIGTNNANPTTMNASFMMPMSAALGQHRMRIGTADSGQLVPNPCYSGAYGVTLDFTVNITVPPCTPPAATASTTLDCVNNQFFVNVNVTALGNGTPTITDGTTTWPVTALGNIQVGPFAFGIPVSLNLQHGVNSLCNVSLGTFNYNACPPVNDNCSNGMALTPTANFASGAQTGTIYEATTTSGVAPSCQASFANDVWYTVVVPASGTLTVETQAAAANSMTDSVIAVYSGSCGALVQVGCDDDLGVGNMSLLSLTGQTPGATLYIGVWKYATAAPTATNSQFQVAAYDASLGTNSFDSANFSYYPNPVKNMLNLSYTENISDVAVYNLLGQQVIAKAINANQSQIDMSHLSSGAYMVKVTADNQVKMIKVIKE